MLLQKFQLQKSVLHIINNTDNHVGTGWKHKHTAVLVNCISKRKNRPLLTKQ